MIETKKPLTRGAKTKNSMTNALTLRESQGLQSYAPQTPQQILEQVSLIQEVMKTAMQENTHYGKIPGCGEKPTLLKPGAEKLLFLFRLGTRLQVSERDLGNGHREYQVTVSVFRQSDGAEVGQGVGSCSTLEAKYRYRAENTNKPVPKEYWESRNQALLGGPSFVRRKVKGTWFIFHQVEHDNPADYYNTCLKMAKKRAQVDATLTCTAASDCFTQDIEEIQENLQVYTGDDPDAVEAHPVQQQAPVRQQGVSEWSKPKPPEIKVQTSQTAPQPAQNGNHSKDWRKAQIHFGKNKDLYLGEIREESLKWYIENWEPKPWPEGSNNYKQVDLDLRMALNQASAELFGGGAPVADDDQIPMDQP